MLDSKQPHDKEGHPTRSGDPKCLLAKFNECWASIKYVNLGGALAYWPLSTHAFTYPTGIRRSTNADLLLGQRLWRWPSINQHWQNAFKYHTALIEDEGQIYNSEVNSSRRQREGHHANANARHGQIRCILTYAHKVDQRSSISRYPGIY